MKIIVTYQKINGVDGVFYELSNNNEVLCIVHYRFSSTDYVVLDSLAVMKDSNRNKGYGSKLLKEAENKLRELKFKYVVVPDWNPEAENFYLKVGFMKQTFKKYKKEILVKDISLKPATSKW